MSEERDVARAAGHRRVAVVTGASSGIGAAAARALAGAGFEVVAGARRMDRLREVAAAAGARALALDVTDPESVERFAAEVPRLDVLVNNAGGAFGLDPIEQPDEGRWREMWEVNVEGLVRVTRVFLDRLIASGDGLIVNVGSIAGFESYPGGAGYTMAKHAVRTFTRTLRLELLGRPVRVTEICPGLVETEFSLVRFAGDRERAAAVYRGMQPLTAEDVADCIAFVATRPAHVDIDEMIIRPRDQAAATLVHREE